MNRPALSREAEIAYRLETWLGAKEARDVMIRKVAAAAEAFVAGKIMHDELGDWVLKLQLAESLVGDSFRAYVESYSQSY